ncbi:organoarsenical effux MFS transporter ArsJ [Marinobacter daepoensis]|uniref:Organoarsenical effux MFS transporter ArsJ n=1 Tax=Marinobacter daepoensis TaxID=262077 RepID=A0ABS3BEE6_9GAMM|nr:organoarsenical effux MFS transporter ArsJ [Marinobacter daepoensis]MBN7770206.1 organoarsenical effux MFS transporter ArsJ [Marinobacter daepoensis]MBY6079652.1 organoarsenical effux MFS transporter ArsJ [Marinobacter daepoensis]
MNSVIRQYLVITGNYWAFTLTDGALRMLVVLHFHQLGYSPLAIALLFIFYELFGVVTNLVGGYLGARLGLNRTMNIGLFLQIVALLMLAVPAAALTVPWVMAAQALSGIAKDLNKMSAKSGIKLLVPDEQQGRLYKWVAILTGSKNTLKGVGFFLGGVLLMSVGFQGAVAAMAMVLGLVWLASLFLLGQDLGKSKAKPKFSDILSKSRAINVLSAARMFLFGARDVWFVVALPVYMATVFGWDHWQVGGFLACWVIGYGFVQTVAPRITGLASGKAGAVFWAALLAGVPAAMAGALVVDWPPEWVVIGGLLLFGILFAINSSLHSYLIVRYARGDGVSLDVGFYYMSNAAGRLMGTLLSGWVYQAWGLEACLWISAALVAMAALLSLGLPDRRDEAIGEQRFV